MTDVIDMDEVREEHLLRELNRTHVSQRLYSAMRLALNATDSRELSDEEVEALKDVAATIMGVLDTSKARWEESTQP